jgi:uracil-DNA glycosylase family 4
MAKKHSREYLEEALKQARQLLPGWAYAMVHQAALPRSGGRAAATDRKPDALERLAISQAQPEHLADLTDDELRDVTKRIRKWTANAEKRKQPIDLFTKASALFGGEVERRKLDLGALLAEAVEDLDEDESEEAEEIAAAYNPDQKRDEAGRFGEGSGGGSKLQRGKAVPVDRIADIPKGAGFGYRNQSWVSEGDNRARTVDRSKERSLTEIADEVKANTGKAWAEVVYYGKSIDVPSAGVEGAPLAFVGASASAIDLARAEPFVGPVGETLNDSYLKPLGVKRAQIFLTNAVPLYLRKEDGTPREPTIDEVKDWRGWLSKELDRSGARVVVALGKTAAFALGDRADVVLPHPGAVRRFGDSGEVGRKLKQIRAKLVAKLATPPAETIDISPQGEGYQSPPAPVEGDRSGLIEKPAEPTPSEEPRALADDTGEKKNDATKPGELPKADDMRGRAIDVTITKADKAKQIVYGVVLDPYQVDAQGDWIPPAEVEDTAHRWLQESRVIGLRHSAKAEAVPVESWIVQYPSAEDYAKAQRNEPHAIFSIPFGSSSVHSGAWVLGTKILDQGLWKEIESGKLGEYSVGGLGVRTPIERGTMPEVRVINV